MAYELRVNHEKLWFQELCAIDISRVTVQDGTDWEALGKVFEQPITTPRPIRRKLQRVSVLRPVVILCWIAVVICIIAIVVANAVVFVEARKLDNAIDDENATLENIKEVDQAVPVKDIGATALALTLFALVMVTVVVALSRWSEKKMREMLRHEVNRVLGSHIDNQAYLLVEQVLLQQPGLSLQRSTVPVNLSVQTADGVKPSDATFRQLRSTLAQLTKRPGLPLFKVFLVSDAFLRDPEVQGNLQHYAAHLQSALDEQRLKVLSYVPRSEQQRLCQQIFAEGDAIRDVQANLNVVMQGTQPRAGGPFA